MQGFDLLLTCICKVKCGAKFLKPLQKATILVGLLVVQVILLRKQYYKNLWVPVRIYYILNCVKVMGTTNYLRLNTIVETRKHDLDKVCTM